MKECHLAWIIRIPQQMQKFCGLQPKVAQDITGHKSQSSHPVSRHGGGEGPWEGLASTLRALESHLLAELTAGEVATLASRGSDLPVLSECILPRLAPGEASEHVNIKCTDS